MPQTLRMLIPVYANFNILDVGGPLDVFRNYAIQRQTDKTQFDITITGATQTVMSYEGAAVTVTRDDTSSKAVIDYTFAEVINNLEKDEFDIMLVPGGPGVEDAVDTSKSLNPEDGSVTIVDVMGAFIKTNPNNKPKWLISICTGAVAVAKTGIFDGHMVTTHFAAIPELQKACPGAKVVRQRWVDAGEVKTPSGGKLRLITSGGISCGLDCSLYVVAEVYQDINMALATAAMMDYNWNYNCTAGNTPAMQCIPLVEQPPQQVRHH